MYVNVLTGATAGSTSAPSASTDGVALRRGMKGLAPGEGFDDDTDEAEILIFGDRGAAAPSLSFVRIRGYNPDADAWFPLGTGTSADTGKLNADAGTPFLIGEAETGKMRHAERIRGLREFTRIHVQLGTLTNDFDADGVSVVLVARG